MRKLLPAFIVSSLLLAPASGSAQQTGSSGKDMCLLYSQNCPNQQMTLQEKIARFKEEINKGTKVYTPAELSRLSDKLKEAEDMLFNIMYGPAAGGISR